MIYMLEFLALKCVLVLEAMRASVAKKGNNLAFSQDGTPQMKFHLASLLIPSMLGCQEHFARGVPHSLHYISLGRSWCHQQTVTWESAACVMSVM